MPEATTCPRRMNEAGPWERAEGLDRWRSGDEAWEEFAWHWRPRRCSFCGSVNPGDALRLLREGWTEEMATGKPYKAYLNPPDDVAALRRGLSGEPGRTPLVKLYVAHLSKEQLAELNDLHFGGPK